MRYRSSWLLCGGALTAVLALALTPTAASASDVFDDVASQVGVTYQRAPSVVNAVREANYARRWVIAFDFWAEPLKWRGAPGVVVFDHDADGDDDVFVTNGPGAPHSLYDNQLVPTGRLAFEDVGARVGVGVPEQDGNGACAGDIDNDGDVDLYVLGRSEPNRLLENLGDGTFVDITDASGTAGGTLSHVSCSMGDVNGDGLLDIFVANAFNMATSWAIFAVPRELSEPNLLFVNLGRNEFLDDSERSGVQNVQEITWAGTLVDMDVDGDVDLVTASDQGAMATARNGGIDRGFIRLYQNDGAGNFTDVTGPRNLSRAGDWMGLSFADLNCDGTMDVFGTNIGDYYIRVFPLAPYTVGDYSSRWFLQRADGTFHDPGVGPLYGTPFGWGTAATDYDNDGDPDVVFYGGLHHVHLNGSDNPGVVLNNPGCSAGFTWHRTAVEADKHAWRNVEGLAVGDLDQDGRTDVVSVASTIKARGNYRALAPSNGGPFDATAWMIEDYHYRGPYVLPNGYFEYSGASYANGDLSIERNVGPSGGAVAVTPLGTVDLTSRGVVNRDGVGAVVAIDRPKTPDTMYPVTAGTSYASQNSRTIQLGLGGSTSAKVNVRWPGGVRNRLYDVKRGERITFPEIPCSYAATWASEAAYEGCVDEALAELVARGVLTTAQSDRFRASAIKARSEGSR